MNVVVAPDSFGGTLSAHDAARAIATGWRLARPADDLTLLPMSDGGEGLLDVVARPTDHWVTCEVADPLGRPRSASLLLRGRTAIIESARACGLALLTETERDPRRTTTYGVGQLLAAAVEQGADRILVGAGGSATVDGGAGALTGWGLRVLRADGSGLKIGGGELADVDRVEGGWAPRVDHVAVEILADVDVPLSEAAERFGPQKGADADAVRDLARGLRRWADVAERDLAGGMTRRHEPGAGAAGGLAFGLACGLGARIGRGAAMVADLVGLDEALADAHVVISGEGRLDATSLGGKVVGTLADYSAARDLGFGVVAGQAADGVGHVGRVVVASPAGPSADPFADVVRAATELAAGWEHV